MRAVQMHHLLNLSTSLLLCLFICNFVIIVTAEEKQDHEPVVIETHQADVTGDGQDETIELKGVLLSEETEYYHKVWSNITRIDGKEWEITYRGGYEPTLNVFNVTRNKINELFYQSATEEKGGLHYYQLDTLANGELQHLSLPEQKLISGKFVENFQAEIRLAPHKQPIVIDKKDRKQEYEKLGLYNSEGGLQTSTPLMIEPIAFFEPVYISKSKGYGLKSYKEINGAYRADHLGTVETLWFYEEGKWTNLKTEWIPNDST